MFKELKAILGKDNKSKEYNLIKELIQEESVISQPINSSRYYQYFDLGISLLYHPLIQVFYAVFLQGYENHGFQIYTGDLIEGIEFSSSQIDVRRVLGKPTKTSSNHSGFNWDRYDDDKTGMHFTYDKIGSRVLAVSIDLLGDDWQLIL